MKLFGLVFILSIFAFGVVMMRIEINRSGRAIGKLQAEVEVKQARNQYLQLEAARLEGPLSVQAATEKLKLRRTPPQHVVVLED